MAIPAEVLLFPNDDAVPDELPIAYYGRGYSEGKNITWKDGIRAVGVLLAVRLGR